MRSSNQMVSVVMPAWNAMPFIRAAIESVISQSYRNLELIVVDDGSTDGNYKVLESIDPRIQVIDGGRVGVSHARNLGMERSRGQYIAFIDADDLWVPGKLKAQVDILETDREIAITFGRILRWTPDADGRYPDVHLQFPDEASMREVKLGDRGWMYLRILMGCPLGMITPLMRREVYERVGGFDVTMERGEDYEFWLRCSRHFEMQEISSIQAIYRIHPNSTMHRVVECNYLTKLLTSAYQKWGLSDPDGRVTSLLSFRRRVGRAHFDHGYIHYWHGNPAVAAYEFWKSFVSGCLISRSVVYWALSQSKRIKHSLQRLMPLPRDQE